jgi:hypothetical protein
MVRLVLAEDRQTALGPGKSGKAELRLPHIGVERFSLESIRPGIHKPERHESWEECASITPIGNMKYSLVNNADGQELWASKT